MRIYLVRHGQSEGNVDPGVYRTKPDHAIDLTDEGRRQARAAGAFFAGVAGDMTPRVWVSPYARTRQTADEFLACGVRIETRREHIAMVEQQMGLFDGVPDAELGERFPAEFAHFKKQEAFGGRFWARMPLGESRYDVALRVHQAFGTFKRDERNGVRDLIIFTHGIVIRAFVMMWSHRPWEWVDAEPNPRNCSIRLLEDGQDRGYIWDGSAPVVESRTETI